jgi:hypothetical protein
LWVSVEAFRPAGVVWAYPPVCGTGHSMILSAQAVPSAARLPCIAALPSGWAAGGASVSNGRALFWLDSDRAGGRAVTVTLTATCDTSGAQRIPSDQPGAARFERPLFSFIAGAAPSLAIPVDTAIAFERRSGLVGYARRIENLPLCGRGAACPR